jgi:queuine/archaeosine tRNA-ribosyltransferase
VRRASVRVSTTPPSPALAPDDVADAVTRGVDTFDSSFPTRLGRHGTALTRDGPIKVGHQRFRDDYAPLDAACDGFVATHYSRAYLHHLWRAHEPVVHGLLTLCDAHARAWLQARRSRGERRATLGGSLPGRTPVVRLTSWPHARVAHAERRHNIKYMMDLMAGLREAILRDEV